MQIKLSNTNAQYLYILTSKIGGTDIKTIRQLKAIFLKIQWQTEDFERKWEVLAFQINLRNEKIAQYKQTGKVKENSEEIEKMEAEMKDIAMEIDNLKNTEIEIDLNGDDCGFLLNSIDAMLEKQIYDEKGNVSCGISGKKELEAMDAVYTALENAK